MALPATIYRITIHLSDIDRRVYKTIQTTVAQHPSETEERLAARLLAMAIFCEPELHEGPQCHRRAGHLGSRARW